ERAELATRMENTLVAPYGVAGGLAGRTGRIVLNPGTPRERELPALGDGIILERGDLLRFETCGGGGWGDPLARDPERVRQDVARGIVTAAGRARTTASYSTPPRSRSTRRRATRSAGAARASYPSSTGVPASTRQKRAGGPASHDHPRCKETLMRDLVTRMNALCDALPFQTSWYLKDLATGETANRLGDTPVPSASTRKISIMMAALKAVHDGKLALDQKVTIDAKYQDNDSGTFQHLTPGFWITFRDALVMMI